MVAFSMRTTVDIPDAKYRALKSKAASEGTTVKALVLSAVEVVLREPAPPKLKGKRIPFPSVRSGNPGKLKIDNERIYDLIGFP
jgi:hypothetical protein